MQRPLPDNTQQSHDKDIYAPCQIWTCNPSKQTASDRHARPCKHWDWPLYSLPSQNYVCLNHEVSCSGHLDHCPCHPHPLHPQHQRNVTKPTCKSIILYVSQTVYVLHTNWILNVYCYNSVFSCHPWKCGHKKLRQRDIQLKSTCY